MIDLFPRGSTPPTVSVAHEPTPEVAPLRLRLVEDREATMMVLSKLLRTSGHRVTEARDVAEALAAEASESFDLVISDLGLPDGTGTELMQKLRATYNLRGISLSGNGKYKDVCRSLEAGYTTHRTKPVASGTLKRAT